METPQIQEKKNFYASFKKWVIDNYGEEISEASWKEIMEDDRYNFSSNTSQLVNAYVPPEVATAEENDSAFDGNNTDEISYDF